MTSQRDLRSRDARGRRRFAPLFVVAALAAVPCPGQEAEPASPDPASRTAVEQDPANDLAIAARLRRIYAQLDGLERIDVDVRFGVVELGGEILSPAAAERAVRIAQAVEGVVAVDDGTSVVRDVAQRLRPALERLRTRVADLLAYVPLLAIAAVVLFAFWLLAALVARWDGLYRRFTDNALLRDLSRHVLRTSIVVLGLVVAFEILEATALVGTVLGAAGLLGLALGFALRDTVENYIAGILLSLRQPFSHDDRVSIAGHEGAVLRLTPRATILMSLDGNHVRIPNATVFNGIVVNYTRNPERRFAFDVGIAPDENLSHAQRLAAETVHAMDGVLEAPAPMCVVEALGDFAVVLRVYGWVDQRKADFQKVRSEAIRLVKEAFDAAGVVMPEPTSNVRIRRATEPATDAARDAAGPRHAVDIGPRTEIEREIAVERQADGSADLLRADAPRE